ncbi:MAG: L-threonylcarbamoyladenylate synthase [Candidatus Nanoarchaeia archaeon]
MKTKIISIDQKNPQEDRIKKASEIILKGGLVAFPTETVYGLGANAFDEKAIAKIFTAKGRPQDNPLIVHISNKKDIYKLSSNVNEKCLNLIEKFWPGPLTIILKKSDLISKKVTAGLDSVAIRMPTNKIALELIKKSTVPIAAPSANKSSKPSPTRATHVLDDLNNKIDAVIDAGEVDIGIESSVLDLSGKTPQLLRPGKITKKQIEKVIGKVEEKTKTKRPKSPGMKYKHYSPNAKVIIISSKKEKETIQKKEPYKKIKLLSYSDETTMAHNLFHDFRECDKEGIQIILVQSIKEKDFGQAIMNRLKKASENKN